MFKVARSALVEYSAEKMFALVDDIESYPEFMKSCVAAELLSRTDREVRARLTLGRSGVEQSFSTRNVLEPPNKMTMYLLEGPFKTFEGYWEFEALAANSCKVSLNLQFVFNNPLLNLTLGKLLESVAGEQVDALCARADKVYGEAPVQK